MRTVLVVDDEFGIVDVLVAALEDAGYRVLTAANGRRGLEQLDESSPDLVILDWMMPLMNGPEMARAMRAHPEHASTPIIMMSVLAETALQEQFGGYEVFLRKPFDLQVLLDAIAATLDRQS